MSQPGPGFDISSVFLQKHASQCLMAARKHNTASPSNNSVCQAWGDGGSVLIQENKTGLDGDAPVVRT